MFLTIFLWVLVQISMWPCADLHISLKNQGKSTRYRMEDAMNSSRSNGNTTNENTVNKIEKKSSPEYLPPTKFPPFIVLKNITIQEYKASSFFPIPRNLSSVMRSKGNINDTNIILEVKTNNITRFPLLSSTSNMVASITTIFRPVLKPKLDKLRVCSVTEVLDVNTNKCRKKLSPAFPVMPSVTSMDIDSLVLQNCSGEWGLMNSHEYTILTNQSIYVNASDTLYDPTQYMRENQSLFVCDNFTAYPVKATLSIHDESLSFLTLVCMSISIIALVFVLVTYSLFAELRTPPGINLMNLSAAILLAQLLWLVGSKQLTDKPMACTAIAVLLHYFFLVSFVWTSIIAFDTWRAFTAKGRRSMADSKRKRVLHALRYMAVGWLSVMVYVSICVALDQSQTVAIGYGSRAACWITNFNAKWIFFATPLGLVTVFNIVFFSMTVKAIRSTRSQARMVDNSANKRDLGVYVRIASVMGFTWVFGFAAPFGWVFLWYVYVILSSLQGVYIAIAFALNKRARKLYYKLCKAKESGSSEGHSGHGRTVETMAVSTQIDSGKGHTKVIIVDKNH